MSAISLPYLDKFQLFKEFIQFNEAPEGEKKRPIISVKANIQKAQEIQNVNFQRTTWHFLTLGIPLLIDSLSLFCSGLIHRETLDFPLRVRFKYERLPLDKVGQLMRFHQFNQISSKALNEAAENKASQQMLKLTNQLEQAKRLGHSQEVDECHAKLNALKSVLDKNAIARMTRNDFNEADWKVADAIDFELTQDYFEELTDLFNANWVASSGIKAKLKADLGIDYQEAVVAESLALSLAYIEGIEGKTISLPVYDEAKKKYLPAVFTIRQTTVGDSLPCYLLESDNPRVSPWMIVRGTQPYIRISLNNKEYRQGGLESILADSLDPDCISRNVINKALSNRPVIEQNGQFIQKESLSDIFRKWKLAGKSVNLSGHSLGGTIVNALAVEFYDQIQTAYAFSGAGVSYKTAERWGELNELYPELNLPSRLLNFDYEGDIVPSGGRRLIGTHLAITALLQLGPSGIYDCHVRSHLNHDFQIQKIDVAKETHKLARVFCERLRIITGKCFYLLLWLFNSKYIPDWWKNRKIYRQRADCERDIRIHLCKT